MLSEYFVTLALELEKDGLLWQPEIGDEVLERGKNKRVSILVDPQGLTPSELRESYLWLPSVEQLVVEIEARDAFLFHAGIGPQKDYEAVIKTSLGLIEAQAESLRAVFAKALHGLLLSVEPVPLH